MSEHVDWYPTPPPAAVLARAPGPGWGAWLTRQGYTVEEQVALLPGLTTAWRGPEADRLAAVLAHLEARPPALVLDVRQGPPMVLDAQAFGRRLLPAGDGGHLDVLTGERWTVAPMAGERAGVGATTGMLLRAAGVGAPLARRVEVEGVQALAWPFLRWWISPSPSSLTGDHQRALALELAADAWLGLLQRHAGGWRPRGLLAREVAIEGTALTCRAELAAGDLEAGVDASLAAALDASGGPFYARARADLALVLDGVDAVLAVPDDEIRRAVDAAGLEAEGRGKLLGAVIARREVLRVRFRR